MWTPEFPPSGGEIFFRDSRTRSRANIWTILHHWQKPAAQLKYCSRQSNEVFAKRSNFVESRLLELHFLFLFFFFFFSLPSAEEWKIYSYWKIEGVSGREKIQKRCHETGVVRLQSLVPGCRCVGLTIMSGAFRSSSSHNFTHTGRRDRWLESSAAEYPAGRLNFALSARWAIPP